MVGGKDLYDGKWLSDEELTAKIAALEENYKIVTEKVAQAAIKSGRKPEEITLLAATKNSSCACY